VLRVDTIERGSQGGWEIGLQQNQTTAPENLKSAAKKRTFSCVLRRFLGMGLKKSQPESQDSPAHRPDSQVA